MKTPAGYVAAILEAVSGRRDAAACVFEGRLSTWSEILDQAARIAGGLRALGLADGDRVGVLSLNSDTYLALYLAIPWAGGVIVPLNTRWSGIENRFAINDCGLRLVFSGPEEWTADFDLKVGETPLLVLLGPVSGSIGELTLDVLLNHDPIDDRGRAGNDLFAIFYTGGTTGRPKGVMLSHAGFVANCRAMRDLGICPDGCRMLISAPLFHVAAAAALTMSMLGGTAVITRGFDPSLVLDVIAREGVTDALLVPTMIQMLLDAHDFTPVAFANLKAVLYGASPMSEALLDRMMAACPHLEFHQAYGMTEVSCAATVLGPDMHRGEHRSAGRHRGAGRAIATAEIMIADEAGEPKPIGEVGEILVRGDGVMLGYWNQPRLTAEALRDGWMHTGDGGRMDDHGILYVVDRIKDMIVTGGENVFSAEVEGALAHHPGIAQCAVIGVPDQRWGERVHAIIVRRPGAHTSPAAIIDHCRTLIAGYKCPRSVEFRNALPLSAAGKIVKADLRAAYLKELDADVI